METQHEGNTLMCIKALHLHIRYIPIMAIGVSAGEMTTPIDFHADIPCR